MYYNRLMKSRLMRHQQKNQNRQLVVWLLILGLFMVSLYKFGVPIFLWVVDRMIPSSGVTTTEDSVVPQSPMLAAMNEATFSASIKVTGATSGGAKVQLSDQSGAIYTATADEGGYFDIDGVKLVKGENTIAVWAENSKGEQSSKTQFTLTRDDEAPQLTIDEPSNGARFSGLSEKNMAVRGGLDENGSVRVNGTVVWLNSEHKFSQSMTLQPGDNTIKVEASDLAGNQTATELKVNYQP